MARGSLLGTADATLVNGAYKVAAASAPPDLSRIHERISNAYASSIATTGEIWGTAIAVAGKIGGQLIKQAKENRAAEPQWNQAPFEVKTASGEGGEIQNAEEGQVFAHTDMNNNVQPVKLQTTREAIREIRRQKFRVSMFGDSDLSREERKAERDRLNRKLDNIRASNSTFKTFETVMTKMLDDNNVNFKASTMYGLNKMNFANALLAKGKPLEDGSRAVMGYSEDGEMTFMYVNKFGEPIKDKDGKDITIKQSNIDELLVSKSAKRDGMNALFNPNDQYQKHKLPFDANPVGSWVEENVTDKNTFLDLAYYRSNNTSGSLASVLNGVTYNNNGEPIIGSTRLSAMIFGELNKLSDAEKAEFETDGKAGITASDFANGENYNKLVDKILSGDDLDLSSAILKSHLNIEAEGYHTKGVEAAARDRRTRAATKTGTGRDNQLQTSFGYQNRIRTDAFVNGIVSGKKKIIDLQGNEFELQPDGTYKSKLQNNDGSFVIRSKVEMIEANEMDVYYPDIYKSIVEGSKVEGGTVESPTVETKDYSDIINYDFIKMTEEDAEQYLKDNLPPGFTFDQYGIGDAIKVMYGDKSVKINLQPNTTGGEDKNIKKLLDFIKEVTNKSQQLIDKYS